MENNKKIAGFTLVELLTSITIFSLLMIIVSSVFVSILNAQRRAFNIQQIEENANFVLESMAKEIRVGQVGVVAEPNCPGAPLMSLAFVHPVNGNIVYSLQGLDVHRSVNGTDTIISSNVVQFTRLQFCISGSVVGDNKQPRITILASVKSTNTLQQQSMDIQTTLSQRSLSN